MMNYVKFLFIFSFLSICMGQSFPIVGEPQIISGQINPGNLIKFNDKVIFSAETVENGREIWISDGTTTGTTILKDIVLGSGSSSPSSLVKFNSHIYFTVGNKLWRTDGTTIGTVEVLDFDLHKIPINTTSGINSSPTIQGITLENTSSGLLAVINYADSSPLNHRFVFKVDTEFNDVDFLNLVIFSFIINRENLNFEFLQGTGATPTGGNSYSISRGILLNGAPTTTQLNSCSGRGAIYSANLTLNNSQGFNQDISFVDENLSREIIAKCIVFSLEPNTVFESFLFRVFTDDEISTSNVSPIFTNSSENLVLGLMNPNRNLNSIFGYDFELNKIILLNLQNNSLEYNISPTGSVPSLDQSYFLTTLRGKTYYHSTNAFYLNSGIYYMLNSDGSAKDVISRESETKESKYVFAANFSDQRSYVEFTNYIILADQFGKLIYRTLAEDLCPDSASKSVPGICGCGVADTDSDNDGTADCNETCDLDSNKTLAGQCGCGIADTDSDNDGAADCNETCDFDSLKTSPGSCGCGIPDTDSDSDGISNCEDQCSSDPAKILIGVCGCGVLDVDLNQNSTVDCLDTNSFAQMLTLASVRSTRVKIYININNNIKKGNYKFSYSFYDKKKKRILTKTVFIKKTSTLSIKPIKDSKFFSYSFVAKAPTYRDKVFSRNYLKLK